MTKLNMHTVIQSRKAKTYNKTNPNTGRLFNLKIAFSYNLQPKEKAPKVALFVFKLKCGLSVLMKVEQVIKYQSDTCCSMFLRLIMKY